MLVKEILFEMSQTNTLLLTKPDFLFAYYGAKQIVLRQYRNTKLGPFWIILAQAIVLFSLAFVFHNIFKKEFADFLPYLSAGLIVWNLMSGAIVQAPSIYVASSSVIHAFRLNYAIFPAQNFIGQLILFAHGLSLHIVIMVFMGISLTLVPLAILSVLLVACILYPATAVLAVVSARFRDIGPAVTSMTSLIFLVTPVVWQRSMLDPSVEWLVNFNPLVSMIDIVRQPLNGEWPALQATLVCIVLALASVFGGEWFFRRFSRPIPFWV